jgi:acyl carrier protein
MTRQQILDQVRNIILSRNDCLFPDDVAEAASLTYDLGMDSLHLASLIATIKEEIAEVEFTPWYIRAARHGQDTVGGLVDYLEERAAQMPAREPRPAAMPASQVAAVGGAVLETEQP